MTSELDQLAFVTVLIIWKKMFLYEVFSLLAESITEYHEAL